MTSFDKAWNVVKEQGGTQGDENSCSKCGSFIHFQDEPFWSAGECRNCISKEEEPDCECITTDMSGTCLHCLRTEEEQQALRVKKEEEPIERETLDQTEENSDKLSGLIDFFSREGDAPSKFHSQPTQRMIDLPMMPGPQRNPVNPADYLYASPPYKPFSRHRGDISEALGSKGLIDRTRAAGKTPRGREKDE